MTNRDKLFNYVTAPLKSELVTLPGGAQVKVREMTARESSGMAEKKEAGEEAVRRCMVLACSLDPETGEPMFTPPDIEALMAGPAAVVNAIVSAVVRLSNPTVEVAEGN